MKKLRVRFIGEKKTQTLLEIASENHNFIYRPACSLSTCGSLQVPEI